jgi:hypothetical protein
MGRRELSKKAQVHNGKVKHELFNSWQNYFSTTRYYFRRLMNEVMGQE